MSRSTSGRRMPRRPRRFEVLLSLTVLGLSAPWAEASPIRQHAVGAPGARDLRAWSSFLAGGPMLWSHAQAPHISGAVHVAMAQAMGSADPTSSPWVRYLLWRHDLNPRRFDHWHPGLGPALERL